MPRLTPGRGLVEHRPQPAGVQRTVDSAMARIRSHTGEVVGSGFVVATGHVVTCAHVVARALGRKTQEAPVETDTVSLDFPLAAPGVTVQARVAVWHPIDDDKGDIAVLVLVSDPPAGVLPAYLVAAEDFWSHPFRTFGFPRRYDHGVWASGVLRARQAAGWVQMETNSSGYAVEAGFSGAAVWDDELAGVVGMTVAADARRDCGAAYLIPTEELIRAWPRLADRTVPPCPYRGLYPFRERDVSVFHGRQDLTDLLVTEVRRRPLVAVVGPSGSGKSSVVFAGLLPRIVQQQEWLCLGMRPAHASSPLAALAAAFLPFLDPDQAETERLAALGQLTTLLREGHLPDVIDRVLTRAGKTDLLLVVDQCEELFAREDSDANEFLTVLLSAPRSLTVVLTLRADFLGQALQDPTLAAALEGSVTTIGQMGRNQLRAVIEGPLPQDVTYETGLVERILGDVGEEPGSLPLLEFALTLLWERQDQGTLTHSAYEQLGGVSGALASYAERVYLDQLLPEDQEETRRLLIQLIRPSDVGQPVRRIARRPELGEPRWRLAQRLAATRLLVTDRDPTGVESVELVHEALISRWSRLSEWFDADLAFRTWQEQLRASLAQWEAVRRDEGALFRGTPLAEAERWLTERPEDLGAPEQQFIHASRALRSRSVRRLRIVVAILTLLVLTASSLGGAALWQSKRTTEQRNQAQSVALATRASSLASYQPDVAMLLAATAYQTAHTREAIDALTGIESYWRYADRLLTTDMTEISQIAFSPTDPTMIALINDHGIEIRDVTTNTVRHQRPTEGIFTSVFSPDGRILAYMQKAELGGNLVLWSHAEEKTRDIPLNLVPNESLGNLKFSSDSTLLGACVGQRIQLWSTKTLLPYRSVPLTQDGTKCAFGFRNNNRELAYVDGDYITTWDITRSSVLAKDSPDQPNRKRSKTENQPFFGKDSIFAVAPDGRSAIYRGYDDLPKSSGWWDFDSQQKQRIERDIERFSNVYFSPEGRRAVITQDVGVTIFDAAKRTPVAIYRNHLSGEKIALSPNGHTVATVDSDAGNEIFGKQNSIALIDADLYHGIHTPIVQAAIQPDNKHLTAVSVDGEVAIYSIENWNLDPIIARSPASDPSSKAILSPNGLYYAYSNDGQNKIHLLDVSSSTALEAPLEGNHPYTSYLSFDPRSEFLACADKSEIILWSTKNHAKNLTVKLPLDYTVRNAAVSPGGEYIATAGTSGEARLWNIHDNTWAPLPFGDAQSVSFSGDGKWLGVDSPREIRLYNLRAKKFARAIPVTAGSYMQFNADDSLLAIDTSQNFSYKISVWKWDARDPQLEGTIRARYGFSFTPDNHLLAIDSGVFVERFDAPSALKHVCHLVHRNLTAEEQNHYLPPGFDYKPTCAGL